MNSNTTVTVAQAQASSAVGLIVADTAAAIAGALPDAGMFSRGTQFMVGASAALPADLALRLMQLGERLHCGSNTITVRDTLAALQQSGLTTGAGPAWPLQVVDAAHHLLAAPLAAFDRICGVTLVGAPTLSFRQLGRLEALPGFAVDLSAHVTLSDSLTNVGAVLLAHPAWFSLIGTLDILLDGSAIGAFSASQLVGLENHGKKVRLSAAGGHTLLPVAAPALELAHHVISLNRLAGQAPVGFIATDQGARIDAAAAVALATLAGFNLGTFELVVADTAADIEAHAEALFGRGYAAIEVTSGDFSASADRLLDAGLHFSAGTSATLSESTTRSAADIAALAALPGFMAAAGASIAVRDSAANLLSLTPASLDLVSAASVAPGAATLTPAQAAALADLPDLGRGAADLVVAGDLASFDTAPPKWRKLGAAIHVTETADRLAARVGIGILHEAACIALAGDAKIVAAQALALALLPGFSVGTASLTVADTAAAVAAAAGSIARVATRVAITDDSPVSVANAAALAALSAGGGLDLPEGALTIADDLAHLLAPDNAPGLALARRVTVLDTGANLAAASLQLWDIAAPSFNLSADCAVTGEQAEILASLGDHFSCGAHRLVLADNAAGVLRHASALATLGISAEVTDSVAAIGYDSVGLQALGRNLHRLIVTDEEAVEAAVAAGVSPFASILHSGAFAVADNAANTIRNLAALGALRGHIALTVIDTAAAIGPRAEDLAVLGDDLTVLLRDDLGVSAATAEALAPLTSRLACTTRLTIADASAAVIAHAPAIASLGSAVESVLLTSGIIVTAAEAAELAPLEAHLVQSLSLRDSVSAIAAEAPALLTLAAAGALADASAHGTCAAEAVRHAPLLNRLRAVVTLSDSAAHVSASVEGLAALHGLADVALTDPGTPTMHLEEPYQAGVAGVLARIGSPFRVAIASRQAGSEALFAERGGVREATLAEAAALRADAIPARIEITDSADAIAIDLASGPTSVLLNAGEQVGRITVVGGTLALPQTTALSLLGGADTVLTRLAAGTIVHVTDATLAELSRLAQIETDRLLITVGDTTKQIATDLLADTSLLRQGGLVVEGVTLTLPGMVLDAAELTALAKYSGLRVGDVRVSVSDTAACIVGLPAAARALAGSIAVVDSAANVGAWFDDLETLDSERLSITLTGEEPSFAIDVERYGADHGTLDSIINCGAVVVGGSAAGIAGLVATLAGDGVVGRIDVADNAARIAAFRPELEMLGERLGTVVVTESATIDIDGYAILQALGATLANHVTLSVCDSAERLALGCNAGNLTLATMLTTARPATIDVATASTLLGEARFGTAHRLTVADRASALLRADFGELAGASPCAAPLRITLTGPETVAPATAAALAVLPGFDDATGWLSIDAPPGAVNVPGILLGDAASIAAFTVLRLPDRPHPGAEAAISSQAAASGPNAVSGIARRAGAIAPETAMVAPRREAAPAEFAGLKGDKMLGNDSLVSVVVAQGAALDAESRLAMAGSSGATVNVYAETGTLVSASIEHRTGFVVTAPERNRGGAFSITESVNGVESAPVVVLDAGTLQDAVSAADAEFAASGAIEVDRGKYLDLYTTGNVPVLDRPALVFDPRARTVSIDIPGHVAVPLIVLGPSTQPRSLGTSEILVKRSA